MPKRLLNCWKGSISTRKINKAVYLALGINLEGKKNCWVCGSQKMKGLSSGSLY